MLHRKTLLFISLFALLGVALEVSASARKGNWNPQAWIVTDKEDSGEEDLDLCHGYAGSQEQICYMILNLTRISRSSLGPKLQEAVDNEYQWCATTIEAHKTVLHAELLAMEESLRVAKQTVLFLANRETELEEELEEANKKRIALQKQLDEMNRNQQQGTDNSADRQRLEEELAAARRAVTKINDEKDKINREKGRLTFHFKRVTKDNEALKSQLSDLKRTTDQHNGDKEVCEVQQTRISTLEQDLQQSRSELLDTQTECNGKVDKLVRKAESRLQEIEALKKQIDENNNLGNAADTENKATILRLQQLEQQYKTNIANLESGVTNLQRELLEEKKSRDKCSNEGEKLRTEKTNVETHLQRCTNTNNQLEDEKKKSAAVLKTKTAELETCIINSITTTTIPTTQKPAQGIVKLATGTYLFQGLVGGKFLSWEAARDHCRTLGMDLVAIESPEENAALAAYGRSLTLFRNWMAWTSGCYSKEQKNFVWQSTNAPFTYKNLINPRSIETNAPSCIGFMSVLAKWSTVHPTQQIQPFICELKK